MNRLVIISTLFVLGSLAGYVLEVFYRRFFSAKKWINPGFCTGPYLPIYGFGLCALYLFALLGNVTGFDDSISGRALLFLYVGRKALWGLYLQQPVLQI